MRYQACRVGVAWGRAPGCQSELQVPCPSRCRMAEARGEGVHLPPGRAKVGLPPRPFLYTVDQLSVMLDLPEAEIMRKYLYFEGRSIGSRKKDLMIARNIAPESAKPEWRIAEREFIRWMRVRGFRFYDRAVFPN